MKAYGANHFGHGFERSARTFRKCSRRRKAQLIDRKRQRTAERRAMLQQLKEGEE